MEKIIEIKNMSKRFGPTIALNNVDITAFPGEILGLIGENGSGKTTLIKTIAGLLENYQGEVFIDGKDLKGLSINGTS